MDTRGESTGAKPAGRGDETPGRDMPLPAWIENEELIPPSTAAAESDAAAGNARRAASGAEDYRMLLTVIAGIALGVAATALPPLIRGPFGTWTYAAMAIMWVTGVSAVILEYLAVLFGSRLYFRRVDVVATTSLALVFLAQAGMFVVIGMGPEQVGPRWFVLFAAYLLIAAAEAEHGRRVIVRAAVPAYGADLVRRFGATLTVLVWMLLATATAALLFVVLWRTPPPSAVFAASVAAFAVVVTVNVQQHRSRDLLERHGVFNGS